MRIRVSFVAAVLLIVSIVSEAAGAQSYFLREEAELSTISPASTDLEPRDFFGRCVAISGNRIVVGANNGGMATDDGSVYVFERSGTTWSHQAQLTSGDEEFGRCVAIYVYELNGTSWVPQSSPLVGAAVAEGDHFGSSVAIDGDIIVAGARFADVSNMGNTLPDAGRVHVFVRAPMGTTWTEQTGPAIEANDGTSFDAESFDEFGHSVSIRGTTIIVGAPREDVSPTLSDDSGAAYVFVQSGTDWVAEQKIVPAARFAFSQFGDCVSIDTGRF